MNANISSACGYPSVTISGNVFSTLDSYTLVALKDISPNTKIDITDNGWQRSNNNRFANTEGALRFTRTSAGGTILKGTIFQLNVVGYASNQNNYQLALSHNLINPGWQVESLYNINSSGTNILNAAVNNDQLLIMNGGAWNFGSGTNNSQYNNSSGNTAEIIFGYNTKNNWGTTNSAGDSTLPGDDSDDPVNFDIRNFHFTSINPLENGGEFQYYNGVWSTASINEWLMRFLNPDYWNIVSNCTEYNTNLIHNPINFIETTTPVSTCVDEPVTLEVDDNTIVTYQWYETSTLTNIGGNPIIGETNYIFSPPTNVVGVYYYYCQMTYKLKWKRNSAEKSSTRMLPSLPYQITINPDPTISLDIHTNP